MIFLNFKNICLFFPTSTIIQTSSISPDFQDEKVSILEDKFSISCLLFHLESVLYLYKSTWPEHSLFVPFFMWINGHHCIAGHLWQILLKLLLYIHKRIRTLLRNAHRPKTKLPLGKDKCIHIRTLEVCTTYLFLHLLRNSSIFLIRCLETIW